MLEFGETLSFVHFVYPLIVPALSSCAVLILCTCFQAASRLLSSGLEYQVVTCPPLCIGVTAPLREYLGTGHSSPPPVLPQPTVSSVHSSGFRMNEKFSLRILEGGCGEQKRVLQLSKVET